MRGLVSLIFVFGAPAKLKKGYVMSESEPEKL